LFICFRALIVEPRGRDKASETRTGKEVKTMRRFNGGHKVVPGMYWNAWDLRVVGVNNEAILPGDRNLVYYRIPFVLVLPLGAILGGIYVFFLPVVSIATAISVLGRRMFGHVLFHARRSVFFGWRPTEAYLAGKKGQGKGEGP
jgi:hypothetical protein